VRAAEEVVGACARRRRRRQGRARRRRRRRRNGGLRVAGGQAGRLGRGGGGLEAEVMESNG